MEDQKTTSQKLKQTKNILAVESDIKLLELNTCKPNAFNSHYKFVGMVISNLLDEAVAQVL